MQVLPGVLVWAAITKYPRLAGGLNNKYVFLTVLEAESSKTKAPADLMSAEGSLPGLQIAAFLLYPHKVNWHRALFSSTSYQGTNLTRGVHSYDLI